MQLNSPLNICETFDGHLINQNDFINNNQVVLPRLQQEFQIKKLRNKRLTSAIKLQKNILKENLEGLDQVENQKNLYFSSSIKKQKLNGTFISDQSMKIQSQQNEISQFPIFLSEIAEQKKNDLQNDRSNIMLNSKNILIQQNDKSLVIDNIRNSINGNDIFINRKLEYIEQKTQNIQIEKPNNIPDENIQNILNSNSINLFHNLINSTNYKNSFSEEVSKENMNQKIQQFDKKSEQSQKNILEEKKVQQSDFLNKCEEICLIKNENYNDLSPKKIEQSFNMNSANGSQKKNVQNSKSQTNQNNQGQSPKSQQQQQAIQLKNSNLKYSKTKQKQIQEINIQNKTQQKIVKYGVNDQQLNINLQNQQQKVQQSSPQKSYTALPQIPDKRLSCQGQQIQEKVSENKQQNQNQANKTYKSSPISKSKLRDQNIKVMQPLKSQQKINPMLNSAEKTREDYSSPVKLPPDINNANQIEYILSSLNQEQAQIYQFQNEYFQKTSNGDVVIYDCDSKIMTFRPKSKKMYEVFLYQDLDYLESKKNIESNKSIPIVGCNEVKQRESLTGKLIFQQVSNDVLLDLHNPQKNTFNKQQSAKDIERVKDICSRYQKQKMVQDFEKTLYIPSELSNQSCHFYSRFDSGNLWRVAQIKPSLRQSPLFDEIPQQNQIQSNQDFLKTQVNSEWQYEYDLYLSSDTNAHEGLQHWFYFKIITKNIEKGQKIKLTIRNLHRQRSLYEHGMLPKIYYDDQDRYKNCKEKQGWHIDAQVTQSIYYFTTDQNDNFDPECLFRDKNLYSLTFIYQVQELNESIYFAYDEPYSYNENLRQYIDNLRNEIKYREYLQVSTLCKSLGGNEIRLITVTDGVRYGLNYYDMLKLMLKKEVRDRFQLRSEFENLPKAEKVSKLEQISKKRQKILENIKNDNQNQLMTQGDEDSDMDVGIDSKYMQHLIVHQDKKVMIITSRVHSGEVQSSFALEGFLNFLISDDPKAEQIRLNYIIFVVPMLNPDGVIFGNQRTDLAGYDMNRRWSEPSPWLHPVIYAVKLLARMIKEERTIDVFCDIHGHFQPSRGFMYCCSLNKGQGISRQDLENEAKLRIVPHYLGEINNHFTIKQSSFSMEAYKSGSSRQAMFNEFQILNSFTLENSFFAKFSDQELNEMNEIQKNVDAQQIIKQNLESRLLQSPDQKDKLELLTQSPSPLKLKLTDESYVNKFDQDDSPQKKQKDRHHHYTSYDHQRMGQDLCETFYQLFIKSKNQMNEDIQKIYNHYLKKIALRNQLQVPTLVIKSINGSNTKKQSV